MVHRPSGELVSFEVHRAKHIEDQLTKIARRQLRNTADLLTSSPGRRLRSAVHESRKSVKKVRAVAASLKQAGAKLPRKDRKRLKSVARALSKVRDGAAIIDTFDRVRRQFPKHLPEHTYGILRRSLIAARNRNEARAQRDGIVADAVKRLKKTRKSIKTWASPSINASDMVAIVAASYRRSRRAMKHAQATGQSASVHAWRKALKTLWYQLRLARALTIRVAPFIAELERLEGKLGDDHNLVVLGATLRGCRELRSMRAATREIDRLAKRMRQQLRRRAFALGRRLHVRKPDAFARWLRASTKQTRFQRTAA
jgi:CHAD domain-containing protein